jgi:K+-sensing histidine kinase KdpD
MALIVLAVSAFSGRRGVALAGAIAAAGAFDFFFTRPYLTFRISSRHDLQTDLVLLAVGVLSGEIAAYIRRRTRALATNENQLGLLRVLSSLAAQGESSDHLAIIVANELISLLDLRDCSFDIHPNDDPRMARVDRDGRVRWGTYTWPVEHVGLPAKGAVLPIERHGRELGYFLLTPTPGHHVSTEALSLAVAYADQVAAAASWEAAAA